MFPNLFPFGAGEFTFDADYLLWEAQFNVTPVLARRQLLSQLVAGLKSDGIFALADRIYLFPMHDQQSARVSMVNPSSTQITEVNTPTWASDVGYTSTSTSYLDSNYNEATDPVQWVLGDGTVAAYHTNWIDGAYHNCGTRASGMGTGYRPRNGSGNSEVIVQDNATVTDAQTSGNGHHSSSRNSGDVEVYTNGSLINTTASASNPLTSLDFFIMARNIAGSASNIMPSGAQQEYWFIGARLTATQHADLSSRIETYMDALGIGVIP